MDFQGKTYRTPGQLIASLLEARGWTRRSLAMVFDMDETAVARMVADKRPIDAKMALMLEEVFSVDAEIFLKLQRELDLNRARLEVSPDPARAARAVLYGDLPIAEMIKRGWIAAESVRDTKTVERELTRFFGVNSVDQIEILPHAAKKTQVATKATPAQLAWLYRVKEIASEMVVPRYSEVALRAALPKLRNLLTAPEEARKVPRILAESGIRFAIVESLPSAKIDGVCFWLNEQSPIIGMTLRHDRIDNFWFVLRHEIEHVLRGHGRAAAYLDSELEGERAGTGTNIPEEERVANEAATEFCVSHRDLLEFVVRKNPFFAERDILGFSKTLGVHPGLVAGQLQHYLGRYDRFRNHLVKIRSFVAPSAIVDGWGDIAPVGI